MLAALIYLVVVGGTGSGELNPVSACSTHAWPQRSSSCTSFAHPDMPDSLDRGVLLAVILFAAAGSLSLYPRSSSSGAGRPRNAAGLFVARDLMAVESVRRAFVHVFIGLSALFTIGAALLWSPKLIEWWTLADRSVLPPLNFPLSAGPWGHQYDMALLIALLYPAWWLGRPSPTRRVAAVVLGMLGLSVVVVSGSRSILLAVAVATGALGIPVLMRLWRRYRRARWPVLLGLLAVAVAAIVLGVAAPLAERALNLASLDARIAMWGPLTELWLSHPVTGIGPGAFPWALSLTSYFDTRSWAPRHPDNALFQLLPEAGLLGLLALVLAHGFGADGHLPAVGRSRLDGPQSCSSSRASGQIRPTSAFSWSSASRGPPSPAPHRTLDAVRPPGRRRIAVASALALGIIGVAHASTLAGAFAYESARSAVERGSLEEASADSRRRSHWTREWPSITGNMARRRTSPVTRRERSRTWSAR